MKLAETITQHQGALLEDVRSGRLSDLFGLGAAQLQAIQASFQANPGRADELEAIFASGEGLSFHALWPELKALSVWTGGSVGALIPEVERLLGSAVSVIELGYLSSEFRGSINVDPEKNLCIPTIHECFFEFVPVAEHGEADQRFLLVDELELGEQYHVYVTTQEGLYRYFMNDIIEVNGTFLATPSIQFVQKGKGVVNLTGEKLYHDKGCASCHQQNAEDTQGPLLAGCDVERTSMQIRVDATPEIRRNGQTLLRVDRVFVFACKQHASSPRVSDWESSPLRPTFQHFSSRTYPDSPMNLPKRSENHAITML